jgi:hypothetical protein
MGLPRQENHKADALCCIDWYCQKDPRIDGGHYAEFGVMASRPRQPVAPGRLSVLIPIS